MADNYLEKRMEDYRSSKAGSPARRAHKTAAHRRMPGIAVGQGALSEAGRAVMAALTAQGCRVHFTDTDLREGTLAAQQTGALFIPLDSRTDDNIRRLRPEGTDCRIDLADRCITVSGNDCAVKGTVRISDSTSTAAIARAIIFLADSEVVAAEITL